jgi:enoyl-CoA hydratase
VTVRVESRGAIRIVTIDRPNRRNAVDHATADALARAIRTIDGDDDAHVGVLTGAGRTFCAGADLKAIADGRPNRLEPDGVAPMGPSRYVTRIPWIAAIEGHAVAGGLELALWCDLRVMADDATMGVFCRRWGVPLIDGGTVRLPRLIGLSRALDLILTGRPVHADEAMAIGLANRRCASGDALRAAIELAESMSQSPQRCLRADRAATYSAFDGNLPEALAREFEGATEALRHEAVDGATRFANRSRHGADVEDPT